MLKNITLLLLLFAHSCLISAQTIKVGSGSYTTQFPGTDIAGRNSYPSGTPFLIDSLKNKPVPTNDWWSAKVKNAHCDNLFNYPLTLKTVNSGLVTSYIPWGVISDIEPITVGVESLNHNAPYISAYSDWHITMEWKNNSQRFQATVGMGMPIVYYQKDASNKAQIKINSGTATISNEKIIIENAYNGADFVVYAPKGSTWVKNGSIFTSTLNNKNYWSVLMLPQNSSGLAALADSFQKFAYVEPVNTQANWQFDNQKSQITTHFNIQCVVHEGTDSMPLVGLLPHHWAHSTLNNNDYLKFEYGSIRGKIKMIAQNDFSVKHTFKGILPTLPYVNNRSPKFNPLQLKEKIENIQFDGLSTWTDSYNEGQVMNRLIQTARIAHEMGDDKAVNSMLKTVKNRLENWLTHQSGEVAFLFYYNKTWSSLIGYPAGHGQDNNINDHHFHWGYFIHAASFIEEFEPGWASKFGPMVNLLVRDAASPERNDSLFPYLRNFNPFTGHCWANGFASFPQGNDQESTSESMQFNSSLIHWGSITGNDNIRNLGIYLYTTEQSAIEEYWFDKNKRNFGPNQQYALVSRVWGNSYDNGTFWTSDIAASYGIELYPIHGGSLYLAHDTAYAKRLWAEMAKNTGILSNQANDNLWHDVYWKFLSFTDAPKAIDLYNSYSKRNLKFGISDAQTYHWLHAMNGLGRLQSQITANHPLAVVFKKDTQLIYVGKNYSKDTLNIDFSDGYRLVVPPKKLKTSLDLDGKAIIATDFEQVYKGTDVKVYIDSLSFSPDSVQWYSGSTYMGNDPSKLVLKNLATGKYTVFAKIFQNGNTLFTNLLTVIVGEQIPYNKTAKAIPGTIESGHFDEFEGGNGQGISYLDVNFQNLGNYRTSESADVSLDPNEGATLTWIEAGEWTEYTVNIQKDGLYDINIRYANGNSGASGNLILLLNDKVIASRIKFPNTSNWETYGTITVKNVPMLSGRRILKFTFEESGMNLARFTFKWVAELPKKLPVAHAGGNKSVTSSQDSTALNGSLSSAGFLGYLNYEWKQIYGPNKLQLQPYNESNVKLLGLVKGVYKMRLTVSDSLHSDFQEVLVFVQDGGNFKPEISLAQPINGSTLISGQPILISASADDLDGKIRQVRFWLNQKLIYSDSLAPFEFKTSLPLGSHQIYAVAYDDSRDSAISLIHRFKVVSLAGDWRLEPIEGALSVGPNATTLNWWSNSLDDIKTRSCLFDDIYQISEDGRFKNILGNNTWLEGWQNAGKETCGAAVAPHNGSTIGAWHIDSTSGELVIKGKGQFLGLPKATNNGELGAGATEPEMRKYQISLDSNKLTTGIHFGGGYWQFKFVRDAATNSVAKSTLYPVKIIPNPASRIIEVTGINNVKSVKIFDNSGRLLLNCIEKTIDISALPNGVYFVSVVSNSGIANLSLLKTAE